MLKTLPLSHTVQRLICGRSSWSGLTLYDFCSLLHTPTLVGQRYSEKYWFRLLVPLYWSPLYWYALQVSPLTDLPFCSPLHCSWMESGRAMREVWNTFGESKAQLHNVGDTSEPRHLRDDVSHTTFETAHAPFRPWVTFILNPHTYDTMSVIRFLKKGFSRWYIFWSSLRNVCKMSSESGGPWHNVGDTSEPGRILRDVYGWHRTDGRTYGRISGQPITLHNQSSERLLGRSDDLLWRCPRWWWTKSKRWFGNSRLFSRSASRTFFSSTTQLPIGKQWPRISSPTISNLSSYENYYFLSL